MSANNDIMEYVWQYVMNPKLISCAMVDKFHIFRKYQLVPPMRWIGLVITIRDGKLKHALMCSTHQNVPTP